MSYFDAIVSGSFKPGADGQMLFFPWGAMGYGFEVPNEDAERRLRAFLSRLYSGIIPAAVVLAQTTPLWAPMACVLAFCAFYVVWVRRTMRGWKRSAERLSMREAQESMGRDMNGAILPTLFLVSAGFLAASVVLAIAAPERRVDAIPTGLLAGCGCLVFLRMLRARRASGVARPPTDA